MSDRKTVASETIMLADVFARKMTLAILCPNSPAEERQVAAVGAWSAWASLRRRMDALEPFMPKSAEEGFALNQDLLEVGR